VLFSKPKKAVGVDIGSHSVKVVQLSRSGGRLRIDQVAHAVVDRNKMNVDPLQAQADAVREALRIFPLNQALIVGALPGQTVVIRYPRFSDRDRDELAGAVENEAGQSIPYDLAEVLLDWTVLDTFTEGERQMIKVLLVAAKHEVIDARVQIAEAADIAFTILGVDSLALADGAEGCDFLRVGETVAMVNLGAVSTSIHFVKDGVSNFIRDVSWGARELIQAIAKANRCEVNEAQQILMRSTHSASEGQGEEGKTPAASLNEETSKESPKKPGQDQAPSSDLSELGELGDSLLDPLEEELAGAAEPAASSAKSQKTPLGGLEQKRGLEEILAAPLARLVAEVRRSFEFYEHELYEQPVDRLILSGGVAHVPVVRNALAEELGVAHIEVADPTNSALLLGEARALAPIMEQPAQFMVAVGLAARGAAEL